MADVYKVLAQGQLQAATASVYTVPAATMAIVRSVILVNTDTVARTVQLFVNGSASGNAILGSAGAPVSLAPGERVELNSVMTLAATNTIRGVSDAANVVTMTVFGLEIA